MAIQAIPTPRDMHNRSEYGQREVLVGDLPFFNIVQLYLSESCGTGYGSLLVDSHKTSEVIFVAISTEEFYKQSLYVAKYLWDIGYYVEILDSKFPKVDNKRRRNVPTLAVCYDPAIVKMCKLSCPCWDCLISFQDKMSCLGCAQYDAWTRIQKIKEGI